MAYTVPVTLRLADRSDRRALRRLAQLDSRPLPPAPHLVAEREGRIDAVLSLADGEVVADPFRHTAELCELLRRHAAAIEGRAASAPAPQLRALPATVPASA
jgi:hypothetical protein